MATTRTTKAVDTTKTEEAADESKDTAVDTAQNDNAVETVKFDVELSNGEKVELEAIKNRDDLEIELLEFAERGNYAAFMLNAITKRSKFILTAAGAKGRDFKALAEAYSQAVGAVEK